MLSKEQRGIAMRWEKVIEHEIQDKERQKEDLEKEIEELKFKVNIPGRVNELIRDAMTRGLIKIKGMDKPCPRDIGEYVNKLEEEGKSIEVKLKTKREKLASLELEKIIDYQRLIVLKTDLEEK